MSRPFIIKEKKNNLFKQLREYEEYLEFQELKRLKKDEKKEVKKEEKKEEKKGLLHNVSKGELTMWLLFLSPLIGAGVTLVYVQMFLYIQHTIQQVIH